MDENVDSLSINMIKKGGHDRELGVKMLYEKYARNLRRYFLSKTQIQSDADDLVQETFMKIVNGCFTYKGDAELSIWIKRIAKNCLIDFFRNKKTHAFEGFDDSGWEFLESELDKHNGGNSIIDRDDRASWLTENRNVDPSVSKQSIEECVKKVFARFAQDDKERAEALSFVVEGYDTKKIASFLNRTEGATREYLSQCRKKIESYMVPCKELISA